ncbi:MAG: helix-turn-helix transcriptional regulator [bacterium]
MALIDKIAKNIKRLKGNKSFKELSEKAAVPYRTLEKIVFTKEINEPKVSTLNKLAKALKCKVDDLIK